MHEKRQFSHFAFRRSPHSTIDGNHALWRNAMDLFKVGGIAATAAFFQSSRLHYFPKLLFGLDRSEWLRFKLFRMNLHKTFWTAPVISP
jgi:hypothetical protein